MNKSQLLDAVAAKADISKVNAKKCLDALVAVAVETLRAGDKITLSGLGSFVVTKKPARIGRNFKTGTPVEIPPKSVVKFRQSMDNGL